MTNFVGESDVASREAMHQILTLSLYCTTLKYLTNSLENSRCFTLMDSDIEAKTSDLEVYVNREMVGSGFSNMNLIAVFARFE